MPGKPFSDHPRLRRVTNYLRRCSLFSFPQLSVYDCRDNDYSTVPLLEAIMSASCYREIRTSLLYPLRQRSFPFFNRFMSTLRTSVFHLGVLDRGERGLRSSSLRLPCRSTIA